MESIKLLIGATAILFASAFAVIKPINWKVKDDYSVKISGGMAGTFKGLKATILFDEANPEKSKITASINVTTLNTDNALKTKHVKETLEANKFPFITFVSTVIKKTGPGSRYEATGNLTLKGITKEVKLPFSFDSKNNIMDRFPMVTKETFYGILTIVPRDFNLTEQGIPEQVSIELTIPVTK